MSSARRLTSSSASAKLNAPRNYQRRVLAKAVSRRHSRLYRAVRETSECRKTGNLVREQRRLREARLVELLVRIAEAETTHVVAEHVACLVENAADAGKLGHEVRPHSEILRPLPRKYEKYFALAHILPLPSVEAAQNTLAPRLSQAAGAARNDSASRTQ